MSQNFRLDKAGYINRNKKISFKFNGKKYFGYEGDTLASALLANGIHLVGRSFKYHRPRGFIGAGVTAIFSSEGNMVIDEGAQSNYVDDYHNMELAIINTSKENLDEYTVFDQPLLINGNRLSHESLDFVIEIIEYYNNCKVQRRTEPADINIKV